MAAQNGELRIGDARKVLADVADNSTAVVLTDPPHSEGSEPLYEWLAEFAARVLVPGGSLIVYSGHCWLERELAYSAGISVFGGCCRSSTHQASSCPASSSSSSRGQCSGA